MPSTQGYINNFRNQFAFQLYIYSFLLVRRLNFTRQKKTWLHFTYINILSLFPLLLINFVLFPPGAHAIRRWGGGEAKTYIPLPSCFVEICFFSVVLSLARKSHWRHECLTPACTERTWVFRLHNFFFVSSQFVPSNVKKHCQWFCLALIKPLVSYNWLYWKYCLGYVGRSKMGQRRNRPFRLHLLMNWLSHRWHGYLETK